MPPRRATAQPAAAAQTAVAAPAAAAAAVAVQPPAAAPPPPSIHGALEAVLAAARSDAGAPLTPLERLEAVVALLYSEGARNNVSDDKLRGGGIAELLVSLRLGLTQASALHGADAHDAAGGSIELKNSHTTVKGKRRTNFVYAFSARLAGEGNDAYAARIEREWMHKASACHLLSVFRREQHERTYRVEASFMAAYLKNWALARPELRDAASTASLPLLNLGSAPCARCGTYRRVAALAEQSRAYVAADWTPARWRSLVCASVPAQCPQPCVVPLTP